MKKDITQAKVTSSPIIQSIGGNGKTHTNTTRSPENKENILQVLQEKYGSMSFPLAEAISFIESTLQIGRVTTQRALKLGIERKIVESDGRWVYHFLLQESKRNSPEESSAAIPLPASA